jgi:hypothetical protein
MYVRRCSLLRALSRSRGGGYARRAVAVTRAFECGGCGHVCSLASPRVVVRYMTRESSADAILARRFESCGVRRRTERRKATRRTLGGTLWWCDEARSSRDAFKPRALDERRDGPRFKPRALDERRDAPRFKPRSLDDGTPPAGTRRSSRGGSARGRAASSSSSACPRSRSRPRRAISSDDGVPPSLSSQLPVFLF